METEFVASCKKWQEDLSSLLNVIHDEASAGEFAAFIAYAISFPEAFLALVDTYDVVRYAPSFIHHHPSS